MLPHKLTRMEKFGECFSDAKIVATLSQKMSWSHSRGLLSIEKPPQRDFCAEMCRVVFAAADNKYNF